MYGAIAVKSALSVTTRYLQNVDGLVGISQLVVSTYAGIAARRRVANTFAGIVFSKGSDGAGGYDQWHVDDGEGAADDG